MNITALFILQIINIAIALLFFSLFAYRLKYLKHFSQTNKYLNYYPKLRIIFALFYIVLSIALFIYNIVIKLYSNQDYEYFLAGGGGETVNSLILILQLAVLRSQLLKQRPYTGTHLIYFTYLLIISIVRFVLTLISLIQNPNQQFIDMIISSCLMIDTCLQLGYWIAKKQTMPEFQTNNYFSFDQFKNNSNKFIINSKKQLEYDLYTKTVQHNFPYIKSTVKIENNKFKIILEILVSNKILNMNFQQTGITAGQNNRNSIIRNSNKKISQIIRQSINNNNRKSYNNNNYYKKSSHLQIISQNLYNLQQIKQFYLLCGRFQTIKKQIIFNERTLRQIAQNLHIYLSQLFNQRKHYQQFLLNYLNIDKQYIQIYIEKNQELQQDNLQIQQENQISNPLQFRNSLEVNYINKDKLFLNKQLKSSKKKSEIQISSNNDKNCIYLSIQIYKHLWIDNHYIFYIKTINKQDPKKISYSMKRYSDFQQFSNKLYKILQSKSHQFQQNKGYKLPELPKKHLFNLDIEKIRHRRIQLQLYLRKICNDYTLMQIPQFKQAMLKFLNCNQIIYLTPIYQVDFYQDIKVIKGNISKALVDNDYITYYEFKLFRQGIQIRTVTKRFSDFLILHQEIQRWMNNIQICYKNISLPEKHLYKSQTYRHQKLRNYLQNIINIKDSYKIYVLNVFFNISGNNQLSDDTFYSAISFAKSKSKFKSPKFSPGSKQIYQSNQMDQIQSSPEFSFNSSDRRMSALIDQLKIE